MTPANKLTAKLLIEIPKKYGSSVRVWRSNRIDAMAVGSGGKMRRVQAGVDGQGDISGIIAPHGKRLEIEVKAGNDRQSDTQRAFQVMIEKHGGIYILARSVEQCCRDLEAR